jgi:hypothetical protein
MLRQVVLMSNALGIGLPTGSVLGALPCTCSMAGFRSMNICVAAHAMNGFGSDIMLILPSDDAVIYVTLEVQYARYVVPVLRVTP